MAWLHGRRGRVVEAKACLAELESHRNVLLGQKTFEQVTAAYIAVVSESVDARSAATNARGQAQKQGTMRWAPCRRASCGRERPSRGVRDNDSSDWVELAMERQLRRRPRLSKARRSRRADRWRPWNQSLASSRALAVRPSSSCRRCRAWIRPRGRALARRHRRSI